MFVREKILECTIKVKELFDKQEDALKNENEGKMLAKIKKDIVEILIPRVKAKYKKYAKLFNNNITYHINPTGKFVIGGPHGDTGLTGRKIIVDTYAQKVKSNSGKQLYLSL